MDSSKLCEEAEECHSSESGWTMYIGSPFHGGDDNGDTNDDDDDDYGDGGDGKDEHSDDSMASDASSGPSLQGSLSGHDVKDHGHAISHFKHDHVKGYDFQKKTAERPFMEKQKGGLEMRKKEEEEERSSKTKRSSSSNAATSQSGTKVGKSLWLGRRK